MAPSSILSLPYALRYVTPVSILTLLLSTSTGALGAANQLTVSATISAGTYEITKTDHGHEVFLEDFGRLLTPGKPNLPSRIFAIAIPPGAEVVEVTFDPGDAILLPGTYKISPAPLPRVIAEEDPAIYERDKALYEANFDSVYQSDDPYPGKPAEFVRAARYRGYNLVDVRITPFAYRPLSGQLTYYPEVTVHVTYAFPGIPGPIVHDSLRRTEQVAQTIVFNYEQAQEWYARGSSGSRGTHDFVIITLDSLTSSVDPLADWEAHKGRTVEVVTTSWIDSAYSGYDLAAKMRSFLREKYPSEEWGIEDVLLVGDYDNVPIRRTWQDIGYGQPETDFYYAELSLPDDQSWDADGDHHYGEDSDPIDFYAEVNVGRIPWSDPDTVLGICEKSVAYERNDDPAFKKNILLLGAFFWADTDNAVLMEAKADQPWMTDWTMTRMYEKDSDYWSSYDCDYPLLHSNVMQVWPAGTYAFVDWAGHGSPTSAHILGLGMPAFIESGDCPSLNDDYPAIIFADSCSNSDTDELNIGQAMLEQGAVGFLGATKVAFGCPGWNQPYDGSSQSLDYFFTTCVTSEQYTQGAAHQWALREMYTHGLWDYPYYEAFEWGALWGNPDLGIGPPACAHAGWVELDRVKYTCESTATIQVVDCGLNLDDEVIETVEITIDSDSEPAGEILTLYETDAASAQFEGSIALSETNAAGVLLIAEGDTVTAIYIDEDDGQGGYNVEVTATALVDCTPPEIWNVQTIDIEPRSATVTFDANEVVRGTVHYGLSCDNLSWSASGGYGNPGTVNLSGLQDQTTYFYIVVAVDEAGNEVTDDNDGACYMFTTPDVPNFFTESFESGGNDLDYLTLLFTPNGSVDYYAGCTEEIDELPTDPSGGTPLSIWEDSYAYVTLGDGARVQLYGVSYGGFYACDNGYLTFTGGDSDYTESLADHFNTPRVSALFDDLTAAGGTVSWKQLDDRAVVTYQNVPEYGTSNHNTFQVELYFNGDIRISYLAIAASDGIAGLSEGAGLDPDYYPTDLSAMGSCGPRPPTAEDGEVSTPANTPVTITLVAADDGLPEPPHLDFIIGALPEHGILSDPAADVIESVPYTLVDGGNQAVYTPDMWFMAEDYFQFYANDGGEPPEGGNSNIATVVIDVTPPASEMIYGFPLDSAPGWATEGQWAFGQPTGGGSHNRDPDAGHTGANVYGYNLFGDYSNDMPAYYLTTSAIDCRDLLLVELRFWRWLGVESSQFDHATVEVSNDGTNWTVVWSNPASSISDWSWQPMSLDISAVADGEPTVYIRWGMGPTDYSNTYPGWNVDDVEIWAVDTGPECLGDLDGDGDVDLGDLSILLAHYGMISGAELEDGDLDGDGDVDLADLSELLAVYGTTCP
jgi:hypothetical protein